MATEPLKIAYGGDMMLFLGSATVKRPIAFSTAAKLEITCDTREISSKDSGYWKERLAGKLDWKAGSDALYTEKLIGGLKTGTITTLTSATSLAGVGTAFTTELLPGDSIRKTDGTLIGTVASITSDTAAVLTANAASANSGIAFNADVTISYDMLYSLMTARTPVYFAFASTSGTVPAWTINAAKKNYIGTVIITALSANAPDNETTTYSISLEGTGSLTIQ